MSLSRSTPGGWLEETGELSRSTPFGWVVETQGGANNHSLTASGIAASAPVLGSPSITQQHALSAQSISAGIPVLGQPAIPTDGNHDLIATGIETAPPVLGTPSLTEISGILGAEIPSTGEHGGSPVLNDFSINPAARYSWEVVTPPSAGTLEIFADLTFTWDAFGVADGDYTWVYQLYENSVSVGTAMVYMHVGALVVENITAGIPTLSTPALTEIDAGALLPEGIVSGSPVIGSPALTQNHSLSGGAIAAGSPVFGTPTLAQQHAMMAEGLVAGTPVLGTPAITTGVGTETWPLASDVRLGVTYGPTGSEFVGSMIEGGILKSGQVIRLNMQPESRKIIVKRI